MLRFEAVAEEGVELHPFVAEVEGGVTVWGLPEEGCGLVGFEVGAGKGRCFGLWRGKGSTAVEVRCRELKAEPKKVLRALKAVR